MKCLLLQKFEKSGKLYEPLPQCGGLQHDWLLATVSLKIEWQSYYAVLKRWWIGVRQSFNGVLAKALCEYYDKADTVACYSMLSFVFVTSAFASWWKGTLLSTAEPAADWWPWEVQYSFLAQIPFISPLHRFFGPTIHFSNEYPEKSLIFWTFW